MFSSKSEKKNNTERPYTIEKGTNILTESKKDRILKESMKILNGNHKSGETHYLWDGKARKRVVKILRKKLFSLSSGII